MEDKPQYGEDGFIPTIEKISAYGDTIVMETIDGREETDIISEAGEDLERRGDRVSEEQQEQLGLYERN